MKRLILAVLSALGWLFINEPIEAANALYFTSSPGSWVGHGQTETFTSPTTAFSAVFIAPYDNGVELRFIDGITNRYFLDLIGPAQTLPTVGFYPDATRYSVSDSGVGLQFFGNGRADNTLSGYFNVLQANYDTSGNIVSFAVDFMQYDDCVTANWVSGSFRYNSDIPIPEPATLLLLGLGAVIVRKKTRN